MLTRCRTVKGRAWISSALFHFFHLCWNFCVMPHHCPIFAQQALSCLLWFLRFGTSVPCLNALLKIPTMKMRENKNKPTASMLERCRLRCARQTPAWTSSVLTSSLGGDSVNNSFVQTPGLSHPKLLQIRSHGGNLPTPSNMWHPIIPITQLIPNKTSVLHSWQRACSKRQNHSCLQHQHIIQIQTGLESATGSIDLTLLWKDPLFHSPNEIKAKANKLNYIQ